jgi:pimeloyl-ACP methyl ester carboxylesterase
MDMEEAGMTQPDFFTSPQGRRLAYHRLEGKGPGVVFLGGFKSDMDGTKAVHLEDWARAQGRAFLRFDYYGHGQSSEAFTDGSIGDWAADAVAVIGALTKGPQILVGSSMGGWISLLCARSIPGRVAGLVTIAAAPDFTEDSMWAGFDDAQRAELEAQGQVALPSEYGEPYVITKRLIEDGRRNLVLRDPLKLPFPVRFLQGTADADVDKSVALRLLDHAEGHDMRLTLVDGADHRFSDAACLALIETSVEEVIARAGRA